MYWILELSNSLQITWQQWEAAQKQAEYTHNFPVSFTTVYNIYRGAISTKSTGLTNVQANYYGASVISYTTTSFTCFEHSSSYIYTWNAFAIGKKT